MRPEEIVIASMLPKDDILDKIDVKDPREKLASADRIIEKDYGQDDINTPRAIKNSA